jgi:hypothetical protein
MSRRKAQRPTDRSWRQKTVERQQSRPGAVVKLQHPDGSASFCTLSQGEALFDPDARYLAKKLDDDWFRSHPHRSHRIRRLIPGESPGASMQRYIVIRQVKPGFRLRQPFDVVGELPDEEAPEPVAHAYFDLTQEYQSSGRVIPVNELARRINAYAETGRAENPTDDKPRVIH